MEESPTEEGIPVWRGPGIVLRTMGGHRTLPYDNDDG